MSTPTVKPKAMIQDNTRCIGCRACMVACKSWNDRPEDKTDFFAGEGYQNPRDLDANNYTLITFNEIVTGPDPDWVFGRQLCMHCEHPACASACPTNAMFKTDLGPVVFDESRCIGCRACMQACPFIIPKYDYENFAPKIHKCTFCADRLEVGLEPACATVCPTGAISFGDRDDMVVEAKRRIAAAPDQLYPGHLRPRGSRRHQRVAPFLGAVRADRLHHRPAEDGYAGPHSSMVAHDRACVCGVVRGVRCAQLDRAPAHAPRTKRGRTHMNWRIRLTWWDKTLLAIMAVAGIIAFVRFATGIGTIANINNAYPWGWWVGYGIMTMIAIGGVGFTITALVEIFGVHRYHSFLRPAVLMAFLCYASAITMLMVELGRPWMVWMVLVSWAPTSALYEVGWCAFLYLTVLALEFARVPLEQAGWKRTFRIVSAIYIPIMLLGVTLVAPAPVVARHFDDADSAQGERPVVVG